MPKPSLFTTQRGLGSALISSASSSPNWRQVQPPEEEDTTQHGFDGRPRGSRIDWILATPPFLVRRVAMVTDNQEGRYPSDHFPYEAEVEY